MECKNKQKTLTIDERVSLLLGEGAETPCEDEVGAEDVDNLPDWYDDEKFKRGQKFFHDNIYGMFLSKLCGLLTILAIPSVLRILMHTNMSSTPLSAFRRYVATIMHMYVWYVEDFKPGSKLWMSISDVRNRHNSASRKSCKAGVGQISQKDMVLTQFGFMGYALIRPELVGIYSYTNEEMEAFIHVWRVVGHLLGIEDRFNICSGTVEEAKQFCQQLRDKTFVPALHNIDKDFVSMANALIDGMWCFNPGIQYSAFMLFIFKLCDITTQNNNNKEYTIQPTLCTKFSLWILDWELYLYRFYIFKIFINAQEHMSMWLIEYFPFLAYYRFGYRNSHVKILQKVKI